ATPSQAAALAALTQPARARASIAEMVSAFRRRRDLVLRLVEEKLPHCSYVQPNGAFYVFLRVDAEYDAETPDSTSWCSKVLEETGVALVPGAAFGDDRFVRMSFASSDGVLQEAIERLASRER